MSYQQVKYYESLGDYQQAYAIARDDWSANPRLKWPKDTIAWLLIRMMRCNARASMALMSIKSRISTWGYTRLWICSSTMKGRCGRNSTNAVPSTAGKSNFAHENRNQKTIY